MGSVTYDMKGEVVIVTGAARGVGRAIVRRFAESGANVVAADRDAEGLAETVGAHDDAEVWDTVYGVNCRGTFLMTQAAARVMIEQGEGGRIINFSSGVSQKGSAGAAAYASSRAATEAFGRVAAIELAPYDILLNTVSPGLIDTQPKPLPPSMKKGLASRIPTLPLARPGEPEEVANLVLWLASEESSYVAGAVLNVDGGASVGRRAPDAIIDEDVRYDWVTGVKR